MSHDRIVYMANQINDFFKSYPHDQAVKGIKEHIEKFWDPRMLKQIYEIMQKPENGLQPYALEALQILAKEATHAHADVEASG